MLEVLLVVMNIIFFFYLNVFEIVVYLFQVRIIQIIRTHHQKLDIGYGQTI